MSHDKKEKETKENKNMEENINEEKNKQENESYKGVHSEDETAKLQAEVEILTREVNDYKDRFLRKAAEFENYKRRTENDQLNLIKYSAESFIIKLLPTIDDFERSLKHIENSKDTSSVKEGIKLIYDSFMKVLTEQGVHKIEAAGKPFDVNFHEALMQRKAENVEPHTVIEEVQAGYMYKDRVIRHSKVVVSEGSEEEASHSSDDNSITDNNTNNGNK
jgi:molecular chaperone GrpE